MENNPKKVIVQPGAAQQVWAGQEMSFCQFASDMDFSDEFRYGGYISSAAFLDILATIVPDKKSTKNLDKKLPRQLYIEDVKEQLQNPDRSKPSHLAAMSESDWASYKHSIKAKFELCDMTGEDNVPTDDSNVKSMALYRDAGNVYEKKITKRDVSYYNSINSSQRPQTPLLSITNLYTQFFEAHIIGEKHMGRDETFKAFRCKTNCLTKLNVMNLIEHCVQCRPRVQKGTEASRKAEPQRAEKRELKRKAAPTPEDSDETFTPRSKRARNVRSASTRQPANHNTNIKQNNSRYIEAPQDDDDDDEEVSALCGATFFQASGAMSMYNAAQTTSSQPMPSMVQYHNSYTNYPGYGFQPNHFVDPYMSQEQIAQPMEKPSMYNPQNQFGGHQNFPMNGMNGPIHNAPFEPVPAFENFNQNPNHLMPQGGNIDFLPENGLGLLQQYNNNYNNSNYNNNQAQPAEEVAENFENPNALGNANIDPNLFLGFLQFSDNLAIQDNAPLQTKQNAVNNNHAIQNDAPLKMEQDAVNNDNDSFEDFIQYD